MSQQLINVGTTPNDHLGDPLRTAFQKTNANFTELYNLGAVQGVQGIQGSRGTQGIQGIQGSSGVQGTQGIQGIQGRQGIQGSIGTGTQGAQGIQGSQGTQGIQGTQASLDFNFTTKTGATGTVIHDCSTGQIFYHTSPAANFTANFTNLGLVSGLLTEINLYIVQGSQARLPTAIQISGVSQTINWYNGVTPTGTANATNLVTFFVLLNSTTYSVFGKVEMYDVVSGG